MQFLKILAIGFFLFFCLFKPQAQIRGWKTGLQLWTFHEFSFEKALSRAESAGIYNIEIYPGQRIWDESADAIGPGLSAEKMKRLQNLIGKQRMHITSYGVVVCEKPDEWEPNFQFAKELGISVITAEPLERDWELVDKLSLKYDIKVAIHNHPQPSHFCHPDSLLRLIKAYPRYGACVDLGHWVRCGLDVVSSLQKLKGHIVGLHLKDVTPEKSGTLPVSYNDTLLGKGVCNIQGALTELFKQGFKGYFAIEHEANWQHNVPDVIENKKYLRRFQEAIKK